MFLKKFSFIALLLLFCSLTTVSCQSKKSSKVQVVQIEEVKKMLPGVDNNEIQLLDVRTQAEFAKGAIPGALNINIKSPDFEEMVLALDKKKPVLIYCQAGFRSKAASEKIEAMGFSVIYDYQGGYRDWSGSH